MTWWMTCFTPEIPDKFSSVPFDPQMKGILHTRFSAPQGRQAGRNGLRHGSGVKKRKKKSLSTPFRRLRFTQCRWAHHFTKLHIIGFVYYSSLLTIIISFEQYIRTLSVARNSLKLIIKPQRFLFQIFGPQNVFKIMQVIYRLDWIRRLACVWTRDCLTVNFSSSPSETLSTSWSLRKVMNHLSSSSSDSKAIGKQSLLV